MNVTNKTTKTFTISELTEQQAQDLLNMAARIPEDAHRTDSEKETMNCLRQALLQTGLTRGEQHAD